ncbi:uncharacterized protein BDW43DRAFT_303562 [Aspergillus alliaceus]|uniref:uncharacterized protein n=1 Tax=Petromyces alliaceus TaxID=209559 RepID=UPI0012A40F16|nr:uncharacterized protein BDW43DRAFT_303562 [Aspergillus alliaceus]KAB8228863.1 hypothetical protein BDW43DRAFT_303562 [Aspergillus alliaceus]
MRRVLSEVNCVEDLFSMALANREAYKALKGNELLPIKLLEVSMTYWDRGPLAGSQSLAASLYPWHYTPNIYNLIRIKFLILDHCQTIVRLDTIAVLHDPYSGLDSAVDAAIWRVWTFCLLFGCQKGRDADLPSIRCTSPDANYASSVLFILPAGFICNIVEIWTAVAALLGFLQDGTGRARSIGIFDKAHVAVGDIQQKCLMLTLAPTGPYSDPDTAFQRASTYGWTDWIPPTT